MDKKELDKEELDKRLLETKSSEDRLHFIRKYFFHGVPYVFKDREEQYFEFRNKIATQFNVAFTDVFIVGSAKLGFSYHKNTVFSMDSDIDVAIVNEKLFEEYFYKICNYQYMLDNTTQMPSIRELNIYSKFLQYLVKGWMRPDKLPHSYKVKLLQDEWFSFFKTLSNGKSEVGNYGVSGALYKNYTYLETYYVNTIEKYYRSIATIE